MRLLRLTPAVCAALLAGACAGTHWANGAVSKEEWPRDIAVCRSFASHEVNRLVPPDSPEAAPRASGNDPLEIQMRKYDYGKMRDRIFADCMHERGYSQVRD